MPRITLIFTNEIPLLRGVAKPGCVIARRNDEAIFFYSFVLTQKNQKVKALTP